MGRQLSPVKRRLLHRLSFLKLFGLIGIGFGLLVLGSCAEVTRPTPASHEVEACQLAAVLRHPYKTWSLERVSQIFLRVLATAPQVQGQTYPFLGFNWWVTATRKIIVDNVWSPSPAAQAGLKQGDIILAIDNWPLYPWAEKWDRFTRIMGDLFRNVYLGFRFPGVLGRDFIYWSDKYMFTNLYYNPWEWYGRWIYPKWREPWYERERKERPPVIGDFGFWFSTGEILVAIMLDVKHIAMEARGQYLTGPVKLLILRGDKKFLKTLYPQHLPAEYAIFVDGKSRYINAWAAPGQIILSRPLVDFCLNEDELALVIGHELAHQILGHLILGQSQRQLGELVQRFISGFATFHLQRLLDLEQFRVVPLPFFIFPAQKVTESVYSPDIEREADTYGLWYAYQAGYDIDRALAFFERLAAKRHDPFERTYYLASHPTPLERLARLKKIAKYFKAGRAAEIFLQNPELNWQPPPD